MTAEKHLPSPTNPRIKLHQEYVMRTGGYDEIARVESVRHGWETDGLPTTFHALVEELGIEGAIRDVATCHWMTPVDWDDRLVDQPCIECMEVAHA